MRRHLGGRSGAPAFVTVAAALLLAAGTARAGDGLPTTEDGLVSAVRTALEQRDLATFDKLVNWDGATKYRQRAVRYQLRYSLGRPIRSIALEPFPKDGLREVEASGRMRANMPVTERLRVVFDEPDNPYGKPPTAVFLIGHEPQGYRIALVVPTKRPGDD